MIAKWLGVPPWELIRQPIVWQEWGRAAMNAEAGASAEIQKREARRARTARARGGR